MKSLIPLLVLFAVSANAQNIPVLYKNSCASAIKVPSEVTHPEISEIISSFEVDENCNNVFVLKLPRFDGQLKG